MYDIVLFVHLLGVALLLVGLCWSLGGLAVAQRAREVEGVRRALVFVPIAEKLMGPAMLLIVSAGLYMASRHGGDGSIRWSSGWLDVAIGLFVVLSVAGPAIEGARITRIHHEAAAAADGAIPDELRTRLADPLLSHTAAFGSSQVVVFLYLMSVKPGILGALVAAGIATVVSIPLARLMIRTAAASRPVPELPSQSTAPHDEGVRAARHAPRG